MANTVPPAILIKCSCGTVPEFDCWRAAEDEMTSVYSCPPSPRGCGKAGPEIDYPYANEAQARASWNEMREAEGAR